MDNNKQPKVRANDHDSYGVFSLVSLLIPIAGLVLGIVYMAKEDKVSRKLGEHLIVCSILGTMLAILLWFWLVMSQSL